MVYITNSKASKKRHKNENIMLTFVKKIEGIYDYAWSHFLETETLIKLPKGSGMGGAG